MFFFGFSPPDLTWSETAWNWLFQPLVAVFFQTSMSRPGSRRSPCKPFATPPWGVSTQCVWMNSLRFNARSTRRWWLALSETPRPPIGELIRSVSCFANSQNFAPGITCYDMVFNMNSYTFKHIHTLRAMQLCISFLVNCKKNVTSLTKFAKRNSALISLCQKEIHPTDSQAPFPPGCRQWRWWLVNINPAAFIRESSFSSPKTRGFCFFWSHGFFFGAGRSPNLRSFFTFHECHESRYEWSIIWKV